MLSVLGVSLKRATSVLLFGLVPLVMILGTFLPTIHQPTFLYDFRGDLYNAGYAILHGSDPYRAAFLDHLAAVERSGGSPPTAFAVPVYPAPVLLAAAPLSVLPFRAAGAIFTLLAIGALIGGLWLLAVRDWRCYGVAFASWPVLHSLRLGQINEFLLLGVAIVWRCRRQLYAPAAAGAALIVAKLFLWPVGAFFVLGRRWKLAAYMTLFAALLTIVALGSDRL